MDSSTLAALRIEQFLELTEPLTRGAREVAGEPLAGVRAAAH